MGEARVPSAGLRALPKIPDSPGKAPDSPAKIPIFPHVPRSHHSHSPHSYICHISDVKMNQEKNQ